MADKYAHQDLVSRLDTPGWGLVTGNAGMRVEGTLEQMVEATHDRQRKGEAPGLIKNLGTKIELDMLQIEELWRHLGLPT
jgi:hypothetical protein